MYKIKIFTGKKLSGTEKVWLCGPQSPLGSGYQTFFSTSAAPTKLQSKCSKKRNSNKHNDMIFNDFYLERIREVFKKEPKKVWQMEWVHVLVRILTSWTVSSHIHIMTKKLSSKSLFLQYFYIWYSCCLWPLTTGLLLRLGPFFLSSSLLELVLVILARLWARLLLTLWLRNYNN